jgi:hypothetical protein
VGRKKLVRKAEPPSKRGIVWPRWTGFRGMTVRDWLGLENANLGGAGSITNEELEQQAMTLKGATMPTARGTKIGSKTERSASSMNNATVRSRGLRTGGSCIGYRTGGYQLSAKRRHGTTSKRSTSSPTASSNTV